MEKQLLAGADPRVFSTDPEDPEEGRTFVWATTRWYERVVDDETGAVEFPHLFDSEAELHGWLKEEEGIDPEHELSELDVDDDYYRMVREEFMNQTPLYPEAPELSDEEAGESVEPDAESALMHYVGEEEEERRLVED
jgi:hypothetical protein